MKKYFIKEDQKFTISPQKADITSPYLSSYLLFTPIKSGFEIANDGNEIFINQEKNEASKIYITYGDEILVNDKLLIAFENEVWLEDGFADEVLLPLIAGQSKQELPVDYPEWHRSPRIIKRPLDEKISINAPQSKNNSKRDGLIRLILPPLVTLSVTILMTMFRGNALMVLGMAATTMVTFVTSIMGYFSNKKDSKKEEEDRLKNYEFYLTMKSKELEEKSKTQRESLLYHYPSVQELYDMTKDYNSRIYEKTMQDFDFLRFRIGRGVLKNSNEISYSNPERTSETEEIEKRAYNLYKDYLYQKDLPIDISLMTVPVGYVGQRDKVIEQLHLIVNQLTFFHSYHDLQIIPIYPEYEKEKWEWMRYLPHTKLQEINMPTLIYNERTRDQVLSTVNQILKNRKNALDENKGKEMTFSPHYVVMITDKRLIMDHVIMEFFNENPINLGFSLIYVEDVISSLSENVKTVVEVLSSSTARLTLEDGELKDQIINLDHFPNDFDKEYISRRLAGLTHVLNMKSSIPEAVTFIEMYGVKYFDELGVRKRWSEHSPHKSLAVPLGVRAQDDIVELDLHEKRHGPHGLVAGTTGSGKSEIIQSYILSLAVNFHPYDVAFLLIDYKGGGMANLFRNLPHLLGAITNLDKAQSMRALVSINAELKRRQRLFSDNNVNHINQYQKLYKEGAVSEPMPHLFLISDEFAEL